MSVRLKQRRKYDVGQIDRKATKRRQRKGPRYGYLSKSALVTGKKLKLGGIDLGNDELKGLISTQRQSLILQITFVANL